MKPSRFIFSFVWSSLLFFLICRLLFRHSVYFDVIESSVYGMFVASVTFCIQKFQARK